LGWARLGCADVDGDERAVRHNLGQCEMNTIHEPSAFPGRLLRQMAIDFYVILVTRYYTSKQGASFNPSELDHEIFRTRQSHSMFRYKPDVKRVCAMAVNY
jgi:hypothetical protein